MKKKTATKLPNRFVRLSSDMDKKLLRFAKKEGWTISETIRNALSHYLFLNEEER